MANSPITIGPIRLDNFEIPPSVQFGGQYKLAVHRLADGKRIIERLGPSEDEIRFSGIFAGPDASERYRLLNSLRISGKIIWLSWESFRYQVVVKSLVAEYSSAWWIKYSICCVVAHQPVTPNQDTSIVASLVASDLGNALTALQTSGVSLDPLQYGLNLPNALIQGSADNSTATSASQGTLASVQALIDHTSSNLIAGPPLQLFAGSSASSFVNAVSSAALLAQATAGRGYVGRIINGLTGSTG